MRRSRRLATAFFLLAPIAAAQNSPSRPAEVFGLKLSNQEGEVRIELSTSATVPSAEVIATYRDTLILDLPGAVYRALPKRLQVNHAGIRAVRLWMQTENPPLARVVVEIDRTEQYLLSFDGNAVVLRVGPVLQGASQANTPNTAEVFGSRSAKPATRGSASTSVAGALSTIFRPGHGKPAVYKNSKIRTAGQPGAVPVPGNGGAAPVAKSENRVETSPDPALSTPQDSSAAKAQPLDATPNTALGTSQNLPAAPASATKNALAEPPVADSPVVAASKRAKSAIVVLNQFPGTAIKEDSSEDASVQAAKRANPVTTALPPSSPVQAKAVASKPEAVVVALNPPAPSAPASITSSSAPTVDSGSASAKPESPTPPSAAKPEEAARDANSAPAPEPTPAPGGGQPNSALDMRALPAVANPGMRTEFHVKFVEQESAYLDGGRSSGLTEGLKLVVKGPTHDAGAKANATDAPVAELVVVAVAETSAVTEIRTPKRDVVPGDVAYLSAEGIQALVQQQALS